MLNYIIIILKIAKVEEYVWVEFGIVKAHCYPITQLLVQILHSSFRQMDIAWAPFKVKYLRYRCRKDKSNCF